MDSDWQEVQQIQLPLTQDNQFGPIPNIATIAFDTQQELLWVGDIHGRITSYRWPIERQLLRYTALNAHTEDEGPVQQFLFNEKGVISVAAKSVHFMIRRALTLWHLEDKDMVDLSCMSFLAKESSHQILVGGRQKVMFKIDVEEGSILEKVPANSDYIMMKHSRLYICAATNTGSIDFLHPVTLQVVKTWSAHSSKISSMDAKNDFLVTCGWSTRPHGNPSLDTIAKVYDLKKLEQAAPISFPAGAAFVQIHPKLSTTTVVASQNGQIHVADIHNTDHVKVLHMTLAHFMSLMIMSPSGKVWAIADQDNTIHLWGSPHDLQFCEISKPPELADPSMPSLHMAVDADMPLSTIGMPYYYESLFSNWGYDRELKVQKPPAAIDPDILKQLRLDPTGSGRAQWVTNPRKVRRNQVDLNESHLVNGSSTSNNRISDTTNRLASVALSATKEVVPQLYQYARMNYDHKHGVKGFDFERHNKTTYSGLENDIINCYLNPLIQVLRFTVLVRNLALQHVAGSCLSEGCLLCELGFLFDMLEKAGGTACRAMNFLKAFSSRPEAVKLGILEESSPRNKSDARLSTANRFILEQICNDFRRVLQYDFSLDQTLKTNGLQGYQCLNCGFETHRNEFSLVINLMYPDSNLFNRPRNHVPKFSETLGLGFQGEQRSRGWCLGCKKYASMESQRNVVRVSDVLIINAGLEKSPKGRQLWTNPGWLPQEIGITVEGNHIMCIEGQQLQPFRNYRSTTLYELVGLVVEISGTETQSSHLVSFIDVAGSHREPQTESQWHLFNDFVVAPVDQREALDFAPHWKTPVVLIYQVSHARNSIDDSWKKAIDINPLYYDGSMNHLGNPHTLTPNEEYILPGTHVAIDAEFVVLQRKEIEISYSQIEHIIRPPRSAIGRLSVLRGNLGLPNFSLPFIDDYIIVTEPIIDYVTQYSGLSEGDLNPTTSRHAPIHLKVAYKKLWLLLNLGAIFIGHGLYNDFRNCNIHVPDEQYIDTSKLFQKGEYTLRLSFLANYFLKEDIQVGNHDSIEDARSALLLYRKARELIAKGILEQEVDGAHEEWRKRLAFQRLEEPKWVIGAGDLLGGRMTPEVGGRRGVGSRPETPVRRGRGREEGSGLFESPLRGGGDGG